jgi:hypothetical protein
MESNEVALIIVVVAAVAVAAAWFFFQEKRSSKLRARFGPEYDRVVRETGNRRNAEALLARREKRVERFDIRALSESEREHFTERWRSVQATFVDEPRIALESADELLDEVLKARGYPVGDFEERSADISVAHPHVVQNYRAAHEILAKDGTAEVSTEELRRALVYYRELFEELLEIQEPAIMEARHESTLRR